MPEPKNYASSKDRLQVLLDKYQVNADEQQKTLHRMQRELEQLMDQFDINARERASKVAEELSRIVITA